VTQDKQEGRLARWSRRKQQTAEQIRSEDLLAEVEQTDFPQEALPQAQDEDVSQNEDQQPVLSDAEMEPVEDLTENSDFSKFMSPGVSDELRNLALRKMFKAPIFNIRDGLDEYDEDYTTFEKLGDIVTADMRHQMEMEAERKAQAEAQELADSVTSTDEQAGGEEIEEISSDAESDDGLEELDLGSGPDEMTDRLVETTQQDKE